MPPDISLQTYLCQQILLTANHQERQIESSREKVCPCAGGRSLGYIHASALLHEPTVDVDVVTRNTNEQMQPINWVIIIKGTISDTGSQARAFIGCAGSLPLLVRGARQPDRQLQRASFLLGLLTPGRAIKAWCLTGPSSTHPNGTLHCQDRLQDPERHVINRTSLWKASHDRRRYFVSLISNNRSKRASFLLFKSTGCKQLPVILN